MRPPASLPARLVVAIVLLALGAATAVCAVVLHGRWWGLALGVAATAVTLVALPGGWWSRLAFALGFVAVVTVLTDQRAEGDYLVSSDLQGYLLLGFGVLVVLGGVVGLRSRAPGPDDARTPVDSP